MISPPEPQSEHPACDHRRPSSTSQVKASRRFRELGIFLALTAMVVCLLVLAPGFRTVDNLINITRNFAFVGMVAMGMLLVMITGGIDLSVGSVWGQPLSLRRQCCRPDGPRLWRFHSVSA